MFNIFRRKKQDEINLVDEVTSLKETVMDQQVIIKDLQETINKHEKVLYGENGIIIEKLFSNTDKNNPTTYRKYGDWVKTACPTIIDVYSNGTLKTKIGTTKYNIFDLLKLKELIPNLKEYPTWNNLMDKVNLNNKGTVRYLCYGIESGKYDDIFKKWEKLANDEKIVTFDENLADVRIEFSKKYNNQNIRSYTSNGIYFDGFNFKIHHGKYNDTIICNIICLQKILDNFEQVLTDSIIDVQQVSLDFGFKNVNFFKRIINTLISYPTIFTSYLEYYNEKHSFKLNGSSVVVDNQFTGLRLNDVLYIKSIIENNNNLEECTSQLIKHFKEVKNKYVALICIQYNRIPSDWFKKDKKSFLINNPEKRKEQELI